jgi:hypothetical protein
VEYIIHAIGRPFDKKGVANVSFDDLNAPLLQRRCEVAPASADKVVKDANLRSSRG